MNYCNFYRSSDRVAPHNAYTSWDGITESAEYKGYKLTYPDGFVPPFTFNTDDSKKIVPENGASCKKLIHIMTPGLNMMKRQGNI